jgi:adenylylsulfate kinase
VSWAIWITGVPGSGKSAIARVTAAELAARGESARILELDLLRRTLTPAATYADAERQAVYRALVVIARVLTRAGVPVLIDATGHRREWRDLARASIDDFAEVQLVCPLEVARERERTRAAGHHPRGIYERAGRPGATVPGVDVAYEPAGSPELVIDTTTVTVEEAGARVAALARTLARRDATPASDAGRAIWITGRPGSGKTTVASGVSERLSRRGMRVTVLDPFEFVTTVAPDAGLSPAQREIVSRAILLAAKLLADAGVTVVIDGALPCRDTGRLARDVVDGLVQIELACPPAVCRTRERAVRWNLVPCPRAPRPMAPPDLGLDYEPARAPDLTLYTDVLDEATTAEEILRLVDRLERAVRERRRPCA